MKIRRDFVTNSSSSSFLLAFKDKDDGIVQIASMIGEYGSNTIATLLEDFANANPIPYEDVLERVSRYIKTDVWWSLCYSGRTSARDIWLENNPGKRIWDYGDSEEFKKDSDIRTEEINDALLRDIGDNRYIVELEYEDHTRVGSDLEHEILPTAPFVVKIFNHH